MSSNTEHVNLPTATRHENSEPPFSAEKVGLFIFFLIFGIFGLWSALAPLDGAAFAPGRVTVKSYKKNVQHLEGGIVAEIFALDGELIQAGSPILALEETQQLAQLEIAESQRVSLATREARLIAERDGADEITYPSELSNSIDRVRAEKAGQLAIFSARKISKEGRTQILTQRVQQLENQVIGMEAQLKAKELLAQSYQEEFLDSKSLLEKGFSDKSLLRQAERNFASYSGEAAELVAEIAATKVRISETQLEILQLESEFLSEVVSELDEVQTSLQDATERVVALKDIVDRTIIRAPDSGIINGMQVHTIGGVIRGGETIAEIVPESDDLIIEAAVNPIDIDRVSENQDARIRFSTFGSRAPTIFGNVLSISADAMTNEGTGLTYYDARIEIKPDSLESLGDLDLIPGMPAEVFINTGSRTLIQYLFKPLSNAVSRSFNED